MRKALGRAVSAAVLAGTFVAGAPAWSQEEAGDRTSPLVAPTPTLGTGVTAAGSADGYYNALADYQGESSERSVLDVLSSGRSESPAQFISLEASEPVQKVNSPEPVPVPQSQAPASLEKPAAEAQTSAETQAPAEAQAPVAGQAPQVEQTPASLEKPASEVKDPSEAQTTAETQATAEAQAPVAEQAPQAEQAPAPAGQENKSDANQGESAAPAAEGTTEAQDNHEAGNQEDATAVRSCVFSGEIQDIKTDSLRILGQDESAQPLPLDFILDENSQLAEGLKVGDTVVVYYEVAESGGYRVTSARYPSGDLPKNIFPGDLPSEVASNTAKDANDEDANQENLANVPRVVSIEVEGNKTVSADEVLQVISTRIGDPLLDPRIRRDMQAIYDSGYYTDVKVDTRYAPGGMKLVFRVLENPQVETIEIVGNKIVETATLEGLLQTKCGETLNTRTLQSDLQAINKYYNEDLGYTVNPSHITKLDFSSGKLTITLVDGVEIKGIEVKGVTVFSQDKVNSLVHSKVGDLFNRNAIREDSDRISKLYEDEDYIIDTIKPTLDVDTGIVTLNVTEAVLQDIRVEGNTRTKTDVVLRNVRSKVGEVLRRKKIQRDMERLNNLGLFKNVDVDLIAGDAPGHGILVLKVEEQKTGMASVGVGYAGGGSGGVRPGLTGSISLSERNLFGEGKQGSISLQQGSQIGAYGISYYDPAINSQQDSFGVSVYYNDVKKISQSVNGADYGTYAYYDQKVFGATITYGHPFTDDLRGFITLRHESLDLKPNKDTIYLPIGMGKGDLNSIGLSMVYDTRDDLFTPHHGTYGNVAYTYAGNILGGKYNYTKIVVEGRHYIPVTKRSTLALRGMYGSTGTKSPASEYFYCGGTDTLRGYRDNILFGTNLALFNAEYRFPLGGIKMLSGAVFFDAGNAWTPGVTSNELLTDVGVGLRIVFPSLGLGVIRLDYAHGKEGSRTSIGIGQSF